MAIPLKTTKHTSLMLKKEQAKAKNGQTRDLPLFVGEKDGQTFYIAPIRGKGLWDAIWGYIAMDKDMVIQGAYFDHKGETPGLGANIKQRYFMDDFYGEKLITESGEFKGITVAKGNNDPKNLIKDDYEVDALAGATITGDGVSAMIKSDLKLYLPFFKNLKKSNQLIMGLLSKKDAKLITDPLADNNPITIQVLGICSALAITAELKASFVMGIAVLFVLGIGNVVISLIRNIIPSKIRIIVQLIVVASLVIIVDQVLKAFAYELSKTLSVFVGLIITNCIIMGRFEAFALGNGPWRAFLDGIGNALGYAVILLVVGFFRELLGSGTLFGIPVLGDPIEKTGLYSIGYENNGFMLMPPMALIIVGLIIWVQRTRNKALIED